MINFRLKQLEKIEPWGEEPDLSLHWFGLTEGDLWLTFGNKTIYEYSAEALKYFGDKSTPYNDYYLARFIEDFTEIFQKIGEDIPGKFYDLTKDLEKFQSDAKNWLDTNDTDEGNSSDFYFEEYDKLISWTQERKFNSAHLVGGPHLSFFRRNDKVRIIWDTKHTLENGISLWTAKNDSFEMNYFDFVEKIKIFGQSFFAEMEKQINLVLEKEWGNIEVDKERLVEEHQERKKQFSSSLLQLQQEPIDKTNWVEIEQLFNRMTDEIK